MSGPIARAILTETAADHGLPVAVMLQRSRSPDRVAARFDAMRRLRAVTRLDGRPRFSLPQIGEMFGLHHTSVLNGLRRMEALTSVPHPVRYAAHPPHEGGGLNAELPSPRWGGAGGGVAAPTVGDDPA